MYLDGKDIGLGDVVITDSKITLNGVDINTNCIDIYNKDKKYRFNIWTNCEYEKFNELKLNEKTDIMNLIDDYDIDFCSVEGSTINSFNNSKVYFTRIGTDKYIINAEIDDFKNAVFGSINGHKNLKLETIVDFKTQHKEKE